MPDINLVLNLPNGVITATSLGVSNFAWHRSPGTSRKFHGHSLLIDLPLKDGYPAFEFMNEGGWRDAKADTNIALDAVRTGKRTKTALSNNAFNCTPLTAYSHVYLTKTSGSLLEMQPVERIIQFKGHTSAEKLTPDQVADVAGLPRPEGRQARFYLVISPVEMLLLSNLTPSEYVWYATHRSGKIFRQMVFAELRHHNRDLAAREIFETAFRELSESPNKKTKTITQGDCFRRVPYAEWKGYGNSTEGGLYAGDRDGAYVWRFPKEIPSAWERAD
jgi:hypothetical protein